MIILIKFLVENYLDKLAERYKLNNEEIKDILSNEELQENERILEIMYLVGKKRGTIASGGNIDEEKTARLILDDFRNGKIGRITLEKVN